VSRNGTDVAENHTRKDSVGSTWRATSLVGILGKIDVCVCVRERERESQKLHSPGQHGDRVDCLRSDILG
jgi:hypothetical protein